MEPINFEDDIRKKLQEREIAPSEGAWSKLDAQLAAADAYKKRSFPWLAVAASFIGILIIASVWFSQSSEDATTEIVSEDASIELEIDIAPEKRLEELLPTEKVTKTPERQIEVAVQEIHSDTKVAPIKTSEERTAVPSIKERSTQATDAVAKNELPTQIKEPIKQLEENITPQTMESQAVAQVVAQVKAMQNEQGVVTPENIDLLLSKARNDLQTQRMLSSEKIDPAALLLDVELDLEQGFRDKVFDALGSGFEKIRTAVVERNN